MQIRFLTCLSGLDYVRNAGDVAEVEEAEARSLIAHGFAEEIAAKGKSGAPESASFETPENGTQAKARGRKPGR